MAKKKELKTNAMRFLDENGVEYNHFEFDAESDSENIDGVNKVNENTSDVADDSIDRLLDAANKDNQED